MNGMDLPPLSGPRSALEASDAQMLEATQVHPFGNQPEVPNQPPPKLQNDDAPGGNRKKIIGLGIDRDGFVDILPSKRDVVEDEVGKSIAVSKMRDILQSSRFNLMIGLFIMANTIMIGLELDQHKSAADSDVMFSMLTIQGIHQWIFDMCEVLFFIIFGMEFLLRVVVRGTELLSEFATYIDFLALTPVVLVFLFDLEAGRHLTLLRVIRLLKLCRLLRLLRLCKELNVLVQSIASAMRALFWIGLLLLIVVYCAAIVCTMLIGQDSSFEANDPKVRQWQEVYKEDVHIARYWGSTLRSMMTLFQIFTLDDWNDVVRIVVETHQPSMIIFFVCFIFLTTFGLLNLLMGSIVDHAVSAHKEQEAEKDRIVQDDTKKLMMVVMRLFSMMDNNGDGVLTAKEIAHFLECFTLEDVLHAEMSNLKVKLDYVELMDTCKSIIEAWGHADTGDEEDGITMEEFAGAAMRMQGGAQSRDLLNVHVLTKSILLKVASFQSTAEEMSAKLDKMAFRQEQQDAKFNRLMEAIGKTTAHSVASTHHSTFNAPNPLEGASSYSSELSDEDVGSYRIPTMSTVNDMSLTIERDTFKLRAERDAFKRSGNTMVSSLLQDLQRVPTFAATETGEAIRSYANMRSTSFSSRKPHKKTKSDLKDDGNSQEHPSESPLGPRSKSLPSVAFPLETHTPRTPRTPRIWKQFKGDNGRKSASRSQNVSNDMTYWTR